MYVSTASRARGRRRAIVVLVGVGAVAAVLVAGAAALALSQRNVLPAGTVVAGADVGGLSRDRAERVVETATRDQRRGSVVLTIEGTPARTVTVTGALLGARPRIGEALDAADDVGVLERMTRRLGFGEERIVPVRYDFESGQLSRLEADLAARVGVAAQDASLTVSGRRARVRPSVAGRSLDLDALVRRLSALPQSLVVPVRTVQPAITTDDARAAAATVDGLLERPRTVTIGSLSTRLTPAFFRRALVIEPDEGELAVSLDGTRLQRRLRPVFRDRLRAARSASFRVEGRRALVVPSAPGRELDVAAISRSLLEHPARVVHRARFRSISPALTTAEARALRIRELVSEFTTYYPCCAPRVTNIQRAAQMLDGTVLRPGESFSLNGALGERTVEKGFVYAPQILAGKLEDAVGGGISQVSTTLYNAAFFAGLRLDAHQPHQFYISRYPMGREATISWGGPEMIFTNDWKAGLLIKVSAWSTGVSVRFYSSKLGRRVETETGEPYSYVQPTTRIRKNPALKPGERRVLQEAGPAGFTVEYTRKVYRGDELIKDERYRTRYDAENEFVEVGPKKKPKPAPDKDKGTGTDETGTGETDPAAPPDGDATTPTETTTTPG